MTRPACPQSPGVALHLVQRGRARGACFFGERDRVAYLGWLGGCAVRHECAVHAYVLMGNHVHLLLTPARAGGASRLMRALGERYARHVAAAHGRAGALWEDRFDASPVHAARYFLACMRYIEENPVRAGLVRHPGTYRWSSYRGNALGAEDPLLAPHAFYCALGRSPETRRAAYGALFARSRGGACSRMPAGETADRTWRQRR